MSNQEEIAYLIDELAKSKQELAELRSDPASPAWKIKRTEEAINKHESEIAALRQADAGGSIHNQTISGKAHVGVAISGNSYGPITHQSGGVRYEGGSTHTGDNVAGDKFTGDKVAGNKTQGDSISFGDVSNSNINIKSHLDGVEQSIKVSPHLDAASKAELQGLVKELMVELEKPAAQQSSDAKEMINSATDAAEAVSKEQLDKPKLTVSVEGLKKAALNLGSVLPKLVVPAFKIADILSKLL
jgi:hypothetical protein